MNVMNGERQNTMHMRQWLGLVALAASATSVSCGAAGEADGSQGGEPGGSVAPARVVNVEIVIVQPEPFVEHVTVTGEVEAQRDVSVTSEETGIIREVLADKGDTVREGQPLARIDDRLLRAQRDQAQAEASLTRETWERQRRLWEQDSIGTELAYLQARYRAETAQAALRVLDTRLERATIAAPLAGIVDDRFIEVGSQVSPGTPVMRIVDVNPVEIVAGIPERFSGEIRRGAEAQVTFDHLPDEQFFGRLSFVGMTVDEQSRTFAVEVAVANPAGSLKPGMVARVRTARRSLVDAILVRRDAVLRSEDGYIVYVAMDTGERQIVEARRVTLGASEAGRVVIGEGLEAGDRVVVVGQQQLASGDVIRIVRQQGDR
jgi:membrane fusion protein (multidrug efflux system)